MPVHCERRGALYRLVETATGKLATSSGGKAADGGGHKDKATCQRQANAINANVEHTPEGKKPK